MYKICSSQTKFRCPSHGKRHGKAARLKLTHVSLEAWFPQAPKAHFKSFRNGGNHPKFMPMPKMDFFKCEHKTFIWQPKINFSTEVVFCSPNKVGWKQAGVYYRRAISETAHALSSWDPDTREAEVHGGAVVKVPLHSLSRCHFLCIWRILTQESRRVYIHKTTQIGPCGPIFLPEVFTSSYRIIILFPSFTCLCPNETSP